MPLGLIIAGAILLFLCLLFFLPVSIRLSFCQDFCVSLRVLFLRFSLYPRKKKVNIRHYSKAALRKRYVKAQKKQRKKQQAKQKKKKAQTAKKKKRTASDIVYYLRLILFILKRTKASLLSLFSVRIDRMEAYIASDDAAQTALLYGRVSGLFALIRESADRYIRLRENKKRMFIRPDFLADNCRADICITLSTNLFRLLRFALQAAFAFFISKGKVKRRSGKKQRSSTSNNSERKES